MLHFFIQHLGFLIVLFTSLVWCLKERSSSLLQVLQVLLKKFKWKRIRCMRSRYRPTTLKFKKNSIDRYCFRTVCCCLDDPRWCGVQASNLWPISVGVVRFHLLSVFYFDFIYFQFFCHIYCFFLFLFCFFLSIAFIALII